ncbi:MAG: RHS repeat-associated core domain-containing protein [Ignavibacteriaceae bacterium]|jgi:RHS repeat-associated protein
MYYPFGLTVTTSVSGNENKFKYNGKELEDEHGLNWYHYGVRYYDPQLGRWHTMDPADEFNSPYLYVGNNPVKFIDPDGAQVGTPEFSFSNLFREFFGMNNSNEENYSQIKINTTQAMKSLSNQSKTEFNQNIFNTQKYFNETFTATNFHTAANDLQFWSTVGMYATFGTSASPGFAAAAEIYGGASLAISRYQLASTGGEKYAKQFIWDLTGVAVGLFVPRLIKPGGNLSPLEAGMLRRITSGGINEFQYGFGNYLGF